MATRYNDGSMCSDKTPTIRRDSRNRIVVEATCNVYRGRGWLAVVHREPDDDRGVKIVRDYGSRWDITNTHNVYRDLELTLLPDNGDIVEYWRQATSGRREVSYYRVTMDALVPASQRDIPIVVA